MKKVLITDATRSECIEAIRKDKMKKSTYGSDDSPMYECGSNMGYYVQIQAPGSLETTLIEGSKPSTKTKSGAWGRVWYKGSYLKQFSGPLNVVRQELIKYLQQLTTDSHPLKTYKIKNHDSGKTYRVKATSYTDAKDKYNKHILKDNVVEWKTYEELGKKLRQLGFTDIRVHQIMEALQDGKPIKNVGNLTFKRVTDSIEDEQKVSPSSKVTAAVKKAMQELDLDSSVISREYSFMNANTQQTTIVFTKPRFMNAVYEKLFGKFHRVDKGSNNHLSVFEKVKPTGKVLSGLNALQKAGLSVTTDIEIDEQTNLLIYYPKSITSKAIENIRHNLKANENEVYQNKYKGVVIKKSVLDSLTEDAEKKYGVRATMGNNKGYFLGNYDRSWVSENSNAITKLTKEEAEQLAKQQLRKYGATVVQFEDSITEDAVIYGEWEGSNKDGLWYVNTNDLQETKRELKSAGYKYESHSTNLKGMMYKYTVQYRKDSITEDANDEYEFSKRDYSLSELSDAKRYGLYISEDDKNWIVHGDANKLKLFLQKELSITDSLTEDAAVTDNNSKVAKLKSITNSKYVKAFYGNKENPDYKNNGTNLVKYYKISTTPSDYESTAKLLEKAGEKVIRGLNYNLFVRDSLTEDADIAQTDIKSTYLPEDANADNIQYLGFNEKRKLSFYGYGDRYFVHYDLEGRTEEVDKETVQKILKKNILGEIDENDLINKEPQAEEIVSDDFDWK